MTDEAKLKEQVEEITTTTFSIAGVPIKVFKRFLAFCENNAKMTKIFIDKKGNKQIREELCYSIALAQLLDIAEGNATMQMLYEKFERLEKQVKDGN
tara:strand:+ start:297 stop:587 length:291 start_codon:yes stop_codon:yes gene_type:complete